MKTADVRNYVKAIFRTYSREANVLQGHILIMKNGGVQDWNRQDLIGLYGEVSCKT